MDIRKYQKIFYLKHKLYYKKIYFLFLYFVISYFNCNNFYKFLITLNTCTVFSKVL